jgi:hypothetical protein
LKQRTQLNGVSTSIAKNNLENDLSSNANIKETEANSEFFLKV